tara:strand:- start:139 stop:975 length:837 start_codon:yes stop_codon:yes gene_type:complete
MKQVSYSQYSLWNQCPYQWKLQYVDKIRTYEPSIYSLFGSALHEAIQLYLGCMYNFTIKDADEIDLDDLLRRKMKELYQKEVVEKEFTDFVSREDMVEFYEQGVEILDWFKKKRGQYFNKRSWTLLGIEERLALPIRGDLHFLGFLDVVMKDEISGKIKIIDIKTATMGWNKYQKADVIKSDQLLLYKEYYAQKHNVPVDKIDIEFLIFKRKLWENAQFPQKRIQRHVPANGTPSMNKMRSRFNEFLDACYDEDGNVKTIEYEKCKGKCRAFTKCKDL